MTKPKTKVIFLCTGNTVIFEGSDEAKLAKFRSVRDQIDARLQTWLTARNELVRN